MSYRTDPDLEFLAHIPSEKLDELVAYLIRDNDGSIRLTEELTQSDQFKAFTPDHHRYWQVIAAELQCFGANSFMTMFRGGKGVLYREILEDVCDKLKANYNKKSSTETIEMNLLMKILKDSIEKMSPDELKALIDELHLNVRTIGPEAVTLAIQLLLKQGGFMTYRIALIVANAVAKAILGSGLRLATNATLTRTLSVFIGPIGWILTGLWTAIDLAGPAYRVTVPATIQVAYLRRLPKDDLLS